MHNFKRSIRLTVFFWIMIIIMVGVAVFSSTLVEATRPSKEISRGI